MAATVRRRMVVRGRVQGVFFRDTCRRLADEAGVRGSVRNLPGGDVEACFEGPADAVDAMVRWCRVGPPHASVTGVDIVDEQPTGVPGFTVL